MERLILLIESMLKLISCSELEKNPKAMAKAQRINELIGELKKQKQTQGVVKYINTKMLLEN